MDIRPALLSQPVLPPAQDLVLRGRIIQQVSFWGGAVCLLWSALLHFYSNNAAALTGAGLGELILGIAFILNGLAYRWHHRVDVVTHMAVGTLLLGMHALCWLTGGFLDGAPLLIWTLLVPLGAAQFISMRAGWLWMTAMMAAGVFTAFALPPTVGRLAAMDEFFQRTYMLANLLPASVFVTITVVGLMRGRQQAMAALQDEHERSEALLLNVLPRSIATRLKADPTSIAERFDDASILFADIVGFTALSARVTPEALVDLLNSLFSEFDGLVEKHGLEKIKTIGDAYMAVGGLPDAQEDHAQRVARLALDMLAVVRARQVPGAPVLDVRIGINSGPVVAGVIGRKKFIYDLWGDAVNVASRMESHGVVGAIHVTQATRDKLAAEFTLEDRGTTEIKGRGPMHTWLLRGNAAAGQAA